MLMGVLTPASVAYTAWMCPARTRGIACAVLACMLGTARRLVRAKTGRCTSTSVKDTRHAGLPPQGQQALPVLPNRCQLEDICMLHIFAKWSCQNGQDADER